MHLTILAHFRFMADTRMVKVLRFIVQQITGRIEPSLEIEYDFTVTNFLEVEHHLKSTTWVHGRLIKPSSK